MYTMAKINRVPMVRRRVAYWPTGEEFFRPFMDMANMPMRTRVRETEEAYQFEAELPGYESSEIELTVLEGVMTIAAKHEDGTEGEEGFSRRNAQRSFTIEGIDEDGIAAEYKNGVLRVTLPKAKAPDAPEAKRIDIA